MAQAIRERVPALRMLLHMSDTPAPDGFADYEALLAATEPVADAERHGSDLAGIFYTGGSTGKAKGVMLSHDNMVTNAVNGCYMIGYDPTSVYLHAAPMCYLTDGMSTLSITMAAGTHVFIPRFEVETCLDAMAEHRVTNIALVPTMISMIVNSPGIEKRDLSHLRQFMFGSSPITEGTLKRAVELWPDMKFLHGWGMTELSPIGSMIPHHLRDPRVSGDRLKSCGVAPPNVEVIIADDDGREVPRGTIGEILVRGPIVMQGYWNKPEETAAALARRLAAYRRRRDHGRRRADLYRRPAEGHDHLRRRERVFHRGRERDFGDAGDCRSLGDRHSRSEMGRGRACHRGAAQRRDRDAGGGAGALPQSDRRLQMPAQRGTAKRAFAGVRRRQDPEKRAARAVLARHRTSG